MAVLYILLIISIIFGVLTQYYFIIFMCIFCFVYTILTYSLWKKYLIEYICSITIGCIFCFLIYPDIYQHIFFTYRGQEAFDNLFSIQSYLSSIYQFFRKINKEFFWNSGGYILLVLLFSYFYKYKLSKFRKNEIDSFIMVLITSAILYFFVIAKIAPYTEDRYIFNIFPIIAIIIVYIIYKLFNTTLQYKNYKINKSVALIFILIFMNLLQFCKKHPIRYLYEDKYYKRTVIENKYNNCFAISVTGVNEAWKNISIVPFLISADSFLTIFEDEMDTLDKNIINKCTIVYIDNDIHDKEAILKKFNKILSQNKKIEFLFKEDFFYVYSFSM